MKSARRRKDLRIRSIVHSVGLDVILTCLPEPYASQAQVIVHALLCATVYHSPSILESAQSLCVPAM